MKLDSRIKALSDILTCFDIEKAEQFIGQKGYFADYHSSFTDLSVREVGFLTGIRDHDYSFHQNEDGGYFRFFLPESCLKPKEKMYRPYTLAEFEDEFTIGRPIRFRKKGTTGYERYLILNGYCHGQINGEAITYICIGSNVYILKELFEDYEWHEDATGDWVPFGEEE
jgi:hypothetical protein